MDPKTLAKLKASVAKLKSLSKACVDDGLTVGNTVAENFPQPSMKDLVDKKKRQKLEEIEALKVKKAAPVACAWCKRGKAADGTFSHETKAPAGEPISHGICPDCEAKHFPPESGELKKEIFQGKSGKIHGWVSPRGGYHEMKPEEEHDETIDRMVPRGGAYGKGWLSVGHAGSNNIVGEHEFLNNPDHPATATVKKLVGERLHPDEEVLINVHNHPDGMGHSHKLPAHHFAQHGISKPPSLVAQFHKSGTPFIKRELDPKAGYTIRHEHVVNGDVHQVRAHDKNGEEVGRLATRSKDGQHVEPIVWVHPEHRRKGIATAMLSHLESKTGHKIVRDVHESPAGKALWDTLGKSDDLHLEHYSDAKPDVVHMKLEKSIAEKLDVLKGAMQRLAPYPHGQGENELVDDWQDANKHAAREALPTMKGDMRVRALHRLHGATKVRRAADGKREFLLHRGTDAMDYNRHHHAEFYQGPKRTSWSPRKDIAQSFADSARPSRGGGKIMSAWIHEDSVVHTPHMLGNTSGPESGPGVGHPRANKFRNEHEVIVERGHKFPKASEEETKHAVERKDIHSKIAVRNALMGHVSPKPTAQMDKSDEPLTKEIWDRNFATDPARHEKLQHAERLHGWISPKGDFHQMHPDAVHEDAAKDHHEKHHGPTPEMKNAQDELYNHGWISTMHTGEFNAVGHHKTLKDPSHPATKKLAEMVRGAHPSLGDIKINHLHHPDPNKKTYHEISVSRDLAGKGSFNPSPTQLFRSEVEAADLKKEMWGTEGEWQKHVMPFHGWISPKGDFHQMGRHDIHDRVSGERLGGEGQTGEQSSHNLYGKGWISTGHAGGYNVKGHSKFLNDPSHPATKTLGRMTREQDPDYAAEIDVHHIDTNARHTVYHEDGSKGNFKKPSDVQAFRRAIEEKLDILKTKLRQLGIEGHHQVALQEGKGGKKIGLEEKLRRLQYHLGNIYDHKQVKDLSHEEHGAIHAHKSLGEKADLLKGVMQRLHPYKPEKEVDEYEAESIAHWTTETPREGENEDQYLDEGGKATGSTSVQMERESIPRLIGAGRARALHHLSAKTKVRRAKDGGREFLLHRGMSQTEHAKSRRGSIISHDTSTSWTPDKSTAKGFARGNHGEHKDLKPGRVASAWIHEKHITHIPKQLGAIPNPIRFHEHFNDEGEFKKPKGADFGGHEHEVIVGAGHKSRLHAPTDPKAAKDIHELVNLHGKGHLSPVLLERRYGHKLNRPAPKIKRPKPKQMDFFQSLREKLDILKNALVKNDPIHNVVDVMGMQVNIEWPKGSTRKYKDGFERQMYASYGYLRGADGDDGEELDVYLGDHLDSKRIFVIDQKDSQGGEEKVMMGYRSPEEAKMSYEAHMAPHNFNGIREVTVEDIKRQISKKPGSLPEGEQKPDGTEHIAKN